MHVSTTKGVVMQADMEGDMTAAVLWHRYLVLSPSWKSKDCLTHNVRRGSHGKWRFSRRCVAYHCLLHYHDIGGWKLGMVEVKS